MNQKYRVLHLIKGLGRGGAERLLIEGLRSVDSNRFSYMYGYFLPWKNAFVSELEELGAEVHCFKRTNSVSIVLSAFSLARFCEKRKIDLIHCHLPLAGIAGRLASRISKLRLVYTEHNLMERYHPWTRKGNIWTWSWQTAVIAVSNEVATSIQSHVSSDVPVRVIQNGVPVDSLIAAPQDRIRIREQFGIPSDAMVAGTVAVFRTQKNLFDWIRAAQQIKAAHPNSHFMIVGDGPLRKDLEMEVLALNLEESIHFAGLQENVIPFYSAMDVYLSSSVFEGLPLALLEAMAMNLPVVATAVGGIPEIIDQGVTGFLVEPRSPVLLAEKVMELFRNQNLRKKMGTDGRALIEQRFGIRRMVSSLEDLYLDILEGRITNGYRQNIHTSSLVN